MPCYTTGSREGDLKLSVQESRKESSKNTDMLCRIIRGLSPHDRECLPNDIKAWWEKHEKIDTLIRGED